MDHKFEMRQRVRVTATVGEPDLEGKTGRIIALDGLYYKVQLDRMVPGYGAQIWFFEPSLEAE